MRNLVTYNWLTVFMMVCLVCILCAKYINAQRFKEFFSVILNSKYLKLYTKDINYINGFDGFLFLNLALSLTIFVFFSYQSFVAPLNFEILLFLKLLALIIGFIVFKLLIEYFTGLIFGISEVVNFHIFQKITFRNYAGIVLLGSNFLMIYSNTQKNTIIILFLITVIVINAVGFISSFKNYQKLIALNFFYFLLYLCALEIAPYIILYKMFIDYNA